MVVLDQTLSLSNSVNNVEFWTETFDSVLKISTPCILADNHFFLCQLNAINARLVEKKEVIGGYESYKGHYLKHLH